MDAGNNVESIRIRERETFQVLPETRDHQENQVDRASVPDKSVDYAAADKNGGNYAVTLARPSLIENSDEGINVQEDALYRKKGVEKSFILYYLKQKLPGITQDRIMREE